MYNWSFIFLSPICPQTSAYRQPRGIWDSSAYHVFHLGSEDSSHCAHNQLLLLGDHLFVHQLHVCAKEEGSLSLPPAPGVHQHEQLCVAQSWCRSLVTQQLFQLLPEPEPGCLHSKAWAENVLNCLRDARYSAGLIRAEWIICSVLLE